MAPQALHDSTGLPWDDLEARYRDDSLDRIRCDLGEEQFERAHATGMALSFDEAIDLASGRALPSSSPRTT
jgi:hypothetical protein